MSAAMMGDGCWNRRRWGYAISAVFLLQVWAVLQLGKREEPPPPKPIFRTIVRLAVDDAARAGIEELASHDDPMLLAMPTHRGFSGRAWLQFHTPDYQNVETPEPPRWLAPSEAALGSSFASLLATNMVTPSLVPDKPLPRLPRYDPSLGPELAVGKSRLSFDGELASRPLLTLPDATVPSWPSLEILSNSVVQAAVNADGASVFAFVLTPSGNREADAFALEQVAGGRFRALSMHERATTGRGTLAWGRVIFRWHTVAPVATNAASVLR